MNSLATLVETPSCLGQAEGPLAVDDPEIDGLGLAAHLRGHHLREETEDLGGGPGVDVLVLGKGVAEDRVAGEVGQDPEFDLGIVGGEDEAPLPGDEGPADLPPLLGPDRDVLEVRLRRGEPAGGGHRLVVGGVDPAGRGSTSFGRASV